MPEILNARNAITSGNFEPLLNINPELWYKVVSSGDTGVDQRIMGEFLYYLLKNKRYDYLGSFFSNLNFINPAREIQDYLNNTKDYELIKFLPRNILTSVIVTAYSKDMVKDILNFIKKKPSLYKSIIPTLPKWMTDL